MKKMNKEGLVMLNNSPDSPNSNSSKSNNNDIYLDQNPGQISTPGTH